MPNAVLAATGGASSPVWRDPTLRASGSAHPRSRGLGIAVHSARWSPHVLTRGLSPTLDGLRGHRTRRHVSRRPWRGFRGLVHPSFRPLGVWAPPGASRNGVRLPPSRPDGRTLARPSWSRTARAPMIVTLPCDPESEVGDRGKGARPQGSRHQHPEASFGGPRSGARLGPAVAWAASAPAPRVADRRDSRTRRLRVGSSASPESREPPTPPASFSQSF